MPSRSIGTIYWPWWMLRDSAKDALPQHERAGDMQKIHVIIPN